MFQLKRNMGVMDRTLRTLAGGTLLVLGPLTDLMATDLLSDVILSIMAAVALSSAAVSYCLLYDVTGFDTVEKKE